MSANPRLEKAGTILSQSKPKVGLMDCTAGANNILTLTWRQRDVSGLATGAPRCPLCAINGAPCVWDDPCLGERLEEQAIGSLRVDSCRAGRGRLDRVA
jgi:hypothetical protein